MFAAVGEARAMGPREGRKEESRTVGEWVALRALEQSALAVMEQIDGGGGRRLVRRVDTGGVCYGRRGAT